MYQSLRAAEVLYQSRAVDNRALHTCTALQVILSISSNDHCIIVVRREEERERESYVGRP